MSDNERNKYMNKIAGFMVGSVILWCCIILYQLIAGIFTIFWGYGVATLCLMIYNLIGCIRYIKNIKVIKNARTVPEVEACIYYFENQIPVCWLFMFINLIFGGVLGFAGNLYDLLLCYSVRKNKDRLLTDSGQGVFREVQ